MYQRLQLVSVVVQISAILVVRRCVAQGSGGGSCNITWQEQPEQTALSCDPLGGDIRLKCTAYPTSLEVSWFWTWDVSQAGINGTQIRNAPYSVIPYPSGYEFSVALLFTVDESTVGYYWCEITNADVDVRPSSIVPVCSNSSLPQCPDPYENLTPNVHKECADEGLVISHSGLPTECALFPTPPISDSSVSVSPTSAMDPITSMSMNILLVLSTATSQYEASSVIISVSQLATRSLNFTSPATTDAYFESSFTYPSATQTAVLSSMPALPSSPTSSSSSANGFILYALIGVCLVLAVVAVLISVAIVVLCCLTRRRQTHQVASPNGTKSPIVGVAMTDLRTNGNAGVSSEEKQAIVNQLTASDNEMVLNMAYLEHKRNQALLQQRVIDKPQVAFSNPTYEVTNVSSSSPTCGGSIPASTSSRNNSVSASHNNGGIHQTSPTFLPSQGVAVYAEPDLTKKEQARVVQQSLDQDYDEPADHETILPTSSSTSTVPIVVKTPTSPGSAPADLTPFVDGTKRVSVIYDDIQHEELEQFTKIEAPSPYIEPSLGCSSPADGIYSDPASPPPPSIPPHIITPSPELAAYNVAGPIGIGGIPELATYDTADPVGVNGVPALPGVCSYNHMVCSSPMYDEPGNAILPLPPREQPQPSSLPLVTTAGHYDYANPDQLTPLITAVHPTHESFLDRQQFLEQEYSNLNSGPSTGTAGTFMNQDGGGTSTGYSKLSTEPHLNGSISQSPKGATSIADSEPCYADPWDIHSNIPTGVRRGSSKKRSISHSKPSLNSRSSLFDDPAYESLSSST